MLRYSLDRYSTRLQIALDILLRKTYAVQKSLPFLVPKDMVENKS